MLFKVIARFPIESSRRGSKAAIPQTRTPDSKHSLRQPKARRADEANGWNQCAHADNALHATRQRDFPER